MFLQQQLLETKTTTSLFWSCSRPESLAITVFVLCQVTTFLQVFVTGSWSYSAPCGCISRFQLHLESRRIVLLNTFYDVVPVPLFTVVSRICLTYHRSWSINLPCRCGNLAVPVQFNSFLSVWRLRFMDYNGLLSSGKKTLKHNYTHWQPTKQLQLSSLNLKHTSSMVLAKPMEHIE